MTDVLAAEAIAEEAPAPQVPALTAAQIEAMIATKAQEISDKRVAGLQSMFDKKLSEQAAALRKFQKSFSNEEDDDTPDPRVAELEAELADIRQKSALEAAQRDYPDVFPLYAKLTAADMTAAQQLSVLHEYINQLTAPPSPEAPPEETPEAEPPPTDRNNPRGERLAPTQTEEQADALLKRFTSWPRF